MSLKTKRVLHSFVRGAVGVLATLAIAHYADITKAVTVKDWASLGSLALAILGGAIAAGIRAAQSGTALPSPEPDENAAP